MAITISNLRIMPWSQKDTLKAVFGDVMTLTFAVPHVDGESYLCGLDNERVVYPPARPICAYTDRFVRDGDNITLQLNLTTSKLRDFVSTIRKPMPVWLQLVRVVGDKYETILLDDILALPSVIDGAMTVYEGDPLDAKLKAKMDKPLIDGTIGQVLTMGADGHYAWADLPEIPEQEQANWDESDSTAYSYIRNKPDLSIYVEKVEGKGLSTNDFTNDDKAKLTGIEAGAEVNVQADWGESDSSNDAYIKHKPDLSIYVEKEAGKGLSTNDFTNADKAKLGGIEDGAEVNVQADWDVSDSALDSYIKHKPALATVATTGSYNDLIDKPIIPEQEQSDWDESDSAAVSYIRHKPAINNATVTINQGGVEKSTFTLNQAGDVTVNLNDGAQSDWDESDSSEVSYIKNKPVIPVDATDYLCFTAAQANSTVRLDKSGNALYPNKRIEYSTDKVNWTELEWTTKTGTTITLANIGDKVWYRSADDNTTNYITNAYNHFQFAMSGKIMASGNVNSLIDKTCTMTRFVNIQGSESINLYGLFLNCTALLTPPKLPALFLSKRCYQSLFQGCTSLTTAPELPATTFDEHSYDQIFYGCSSIKLIKVPFTSWEAAYGSDFTSTWLYNVSPTGIFKCPSALDTSTRSGSRVPVGWTVVYTDVYTNADWDESNSTEAAYIKHKPVIPQPEPQVQSDWEESDSSDVSFILNKPDLSGINAEIQDYSAAIKSRIHREPVCATALVDGATLTIYANQGASLNYDLEYSTDQVTWTKCGTFVPYAQSTPVHTFTSAGDKLYLRGSQGTFQGIHICAAGAAPAVNLSGDFMALIDCNSFIPQTTIGDTCFNMVCGFYYAQPNLDFNGLYIDVDTIGVQGLAQAFGYSMNMAHPPVIKANHLKTAALTSVFATGGSYKPTFTSYDFQIVNDLAYCPAFFSGCSNLNEITVHFTEWPEGGITNWVNGVAATGTFRCSTALDTTTRGANYVPEGWTVVNI